MTCPVAVTLYSYPELYSEADRARLQHFIKDFLPRLKLPRQTMAAVDPSVSLRLPYRIFHLSPANTHHSTTKIAYGRFLLVQWSRAGLVGLVDNWTDIWPISFFPWTDPVLGQISDKI